MKNIVRIVLVAALWTLSATAQNLDWSEPGSTGVIDPGTASGGLYTFTGAYFAVAPNAVATVEARYPVTNTVGSATDISPAWTTLQIATHDQYANGSVTATLYEVDACSNVETPLCAVTSSDSDSDVHCNTCTFTGPVDFANHSYYVFVSIVKTDSVADPRLYELAVY